MKLLLIFMILLYMKDISAQIKHVDVQLSGCSKSDKEFVVEHDEDEMIHVDFEQHAVVENLPEFADPITWPGFYEFSVSEQESCKHYLDVSAKAYANPPEALDIPQNTIYPSDDVRFDTENTLICHSMRFFPPPVSIRWSRNGDDVTESATISQFYPNEDNTYNQFSHLPFTPQHGDVYTCSVEHKSLQIPDTMTWEVDVKIPSVGPVVFCALGLAAALLGVIMGTFFLVKANGSGNNFCNTLIKATQNIPLIVVCVTGSAEADTRRCGNKHK